MSLHSRTPGVPGLSHQRLDRHLAEQGHLQLGRLPTTTTRSKNVVAFAITRAQEVTHVFHDSEDGDIGFSKHRHRLPSVNQGDLLRCGHNQRSGERDGLNDRQLDVASARRQIENEVVQLAPCDLTQKLLSVSRHHRPAQNGGRTVIQEIPHRHHRHAMALDRNDAIFIIRGGPLIRAAEHQGDARPINIAIAQADLRP